MLKGKEDRAPLLAETQPPCYRVTFACLFIPAMCTYMYMLSICILTKVIIVVIIIEVHLPCAYRYYSQALGKPTESDGKAFVIGHCIIILSPIPIVMYF